MALNWAMMLLFNRAFSKYSPDGIINCIQRKAWEACMKNSCGVAQHGGDDSRC